MRGAAIAIVLCLGGIAHAGQGAAIPPIKIDFGAVTESVPGDVRSGGETMLGINLATIVPVSIPLDLGVGWINVGTGDRPGEVEQPVPLTSTGGGSPGAVTDHRWTNGWYIEGSGLLASGDHWRSWLSPRIEMFPGDDRTNYGAMIRVSGEVWTGGFYSERGLGVCGVLALGAWAEAGVRQEPNAVTAHVAATGLSLRVPLIVAD